MLGRQEDHVFAARVETERGDVLRIYAFDRFNHTAFQLDAIVLNDTLFVHPKTFNPLPKPINGYWWTNAGQRFTAANQHCKPTAGRVGSRIVAPAAYTVNSGAIGQMRKSPWPHYDQVRAISPSNFCARPQPANHKGAPFSSAAKGGMLGPPESTGVRGTPAGPRTCHGCTPQTGELLTFRDPHGPARGLEAGTTK